jgi:hypothetical protein
MVLTWMVFSSVGLVIARYFKSEWSDKTILGQKIWFQVYTFYPRHNLFRYAQYSQ